jgi:hypothetical protein
MLGCYDINEETNSSDVLSLVGEQVIRYLKIQSLLAGQSL